MREAVLGPLRHVYGASDKVLSVALSSLLLGAGHERDRWVEVGAAMIAIDTLVHNFLAPDRDPDPAERGPSVWTSVLPASRMHIGGGTERP